MGRYVWRGGGGAERAPAAACGGALAVEVMSVDQRGRGDFISAGLGTGPGKASKNRNTWRPPKKIDTQKVYTWVLRGGGGGEQPDYRAPVRLSSVGQFLKNWCFVGGGGGVCYTFSDVPWRWLFGDVWVWGGFGFIFFRNFENTISCSVKFCRGIG